MCHFAPETLERAYKAILEKCENKSKCECHKREWFAEEKYILPEYYAGFWASISYQLEVCSDSKFLAFVKGRKTRQATLLMVK